MKKITRSFAAFISTLLIFQFSFIGKIPIMAASTQIAGDTNGDGIVNSVDCAIAKRYISGLITKLPVDNTLEALDLNGDSQIDFMDISLLKSYILGLIKSFPRPESTPVVSTPEPTSTPVVTSTPRPTSTPVVTSTPKPTSTPIATSTPNTGDPNGRQMENLDRGTVAVKVNTGVFISWRILATEFNGVNYNLYRNNVKINNSPITTSNYVDTNGDANSTYSVSAVVDGFEQAKSASVKVLTNNYLSIPLQKPADMTMPDGTTCSYSANDASVADVDGDHQYEIILKWDPSNSQDNSLSGYTGNVYIDAYKLNGTRLWRIDLGKNIRAGAHYTQFMAYDLDGDGKAEIACKTADGTVDGKGKVIGDASKDYRNSSGYILTGPEYLTVFDGQTGAAKTTINYYPPRGTVSSWGDKYGNRVDRFLACIAYLDGHHPSLVMCRGYYTRTVLAAYDFKNNTLTQRWVFDSDNTGNSEYAGQGDHNLAVADVDGDGKDEITYGACAIDDNGKGLYNTKLNHGDALHVSDLDPDRPGLEVWNVHEAPNPYVADFRDAKTGQVIWGISGTGDNGRGMTADIDPNYKGCEVWSAATALYDCKGNKISDSKPKSDNFAVWWDGDLQRELLDSNRVDKWINGTNSTLFTATECSSNNSTKSTPCLSADIFGDWREEIIWKTTDSSALHIYTTTYTTAVRLYTLMHDPVYRLSIAWQNVAYNQPPMTGFYLGGGMSTAPTPKIYYTP